ncbi:sugar transferase [Cellulomonas sp. KH9]|uniref:sugar transferase n=1 Tax=Cellulomonas sp. KH9 TaxID=1855324 RepID=UPI0008ED34C2|nr:sugar transferase [Cellulomonas sp. KH9]SFK18519.1 Undecaprenyl-phosphate galactose phosphotransferase, WbaP/exopolysaccharide biosynthesis polyprenyl glycosylphosphotransferase [Cellulomonas sp. KH9]
MNTAVDTDRRGTPIGEHAAVPAPHWARAYADRVAVTDAVALAVALGIAYAVRFPLDGRAVVSGEFSPTYLAVSVVLFIAWFAGLTVGRTRDRRLVGTGTNEFSRVVEVTWHLFAAVAVIGFLLRMDFGRGYLGIAAPLGLALVLAGRFAWRSRLHRRRDAGHDRSTVLVVGPRTNVETLIDQFHRNPRAGYEVAGVCLVGADEARAVEHVLGVPVLGSHTRAAELARRHRVTAVAVAGSYSMSHEEVRALAWDLEGSGVDMAVTLNLTDVAGPRVLMQPVNGLPLMYVDEARFTGSKYLVKSAFDWIGALLIIIAIAPLLLTLAILVKATSRGPVLYKQERIGKDGRTFKMLKFRSMQDRAHERLGEVLAAEGTDSLRAFYKPTNDPRVTRVGRVLRRYSLDELPQLLNVLRGEMSLVGPRPQIAAEVATYDRAAHRRLLVKPGLTGLWQVSGRSSLDPSTAIRLDVAYVENWTPFGDLMILARTARAVVSSTGAW